MQNTQLLVTSLLQYANKWHGDQEVVCKTVEGAVTVHTYSQVYQRSQLCALSLQRLGMRPGSIVATLAWNTTRHVECWYGIAGMGAVCHTLNPRLSLKELTYIANDAKDTMLLADITFLPILEQLLPRCPSIKQIILLTDREHMPKDQKLPACLCYEELLQAEQALLPTFAWPTLSDTTPCGLCYTSGTTGNPKGVLYTHRSNFLHALVVVQPDALCLGSRSRALVVVPMFHANAWGIIHAAPLVGAALVLPGPHLDGPNIYDLLESQRVTITAGVPTVWLNLLNHLDANGLKLRHLKKLVVGGSALPRAMLQAFEDRYGVEALHMWGMTEISPLGTVGVLKASLGEAPDRDTVVGIKLKQGRPHIFCDARIVDDAGREVVHDGQAVGELQVRGPIVVQQYFNVAQPPTTDAQGWFDTGDVCSIDRHGCIKITDRSKDVIKSGGEWISSIEVENTAMGCPGVAEAAVIALPHEKWVERPLLLVVPKQPPGGAALKAQVLEYLSRTLASWAVPDDVVFLPELPHTATGKISKLTLRQQFKDYKPATPKL